jgi:hypothetical protein
MKKRKKTDPETLERWERERREFAELMKRRDQRLAAGEARIAAYNAKLRRWTFGLFGREPAQPTQNL